jgi:hypothetical protein
MSRPPEDPNAPEGQMRGRRSPPTQSYHIYVRRQEPRVVFGSVDAGVPNPTGSDGRTFLDAVWDQAPFQDHTQFVSAVEEMVSEWEGSGRITESDGAAIVDAARRAEADLQV